MVNQVVVALNCMATTEGMRLGEALGLDMKQVMAAITSGAAGSWSLSNLGPAWLDRAFEPGFRLRHLLKDIRAVREAIDSLPPDRARLFPGSELALGLIDESVRKGYGDLNIHAMAKPFLENEEPTGDKS